MYMEKLTKHREVLLRLLTFCKLWTYNKLSFLPAQPFIQLLIKIPIVIILMCAVVYFCEGMELRKIQRRVDGSQAATGSSSPAFFSLRFQTCDPSVCFSSSACLCFCEIQPLPTQIWRALILWDPVVPCTDLSCLDLIYGSFFDVLVQVYSRPWHRWFKEQPSIQEGELDITMLSGLVPFLNIIVSASHILPDALPYPFRMCCGVLKKNLGTSVIRKVPIFRNISTRLLLS
jgi:hypothetical protein